MTLTPTLGRADSFATTSDAGVAVIPLDGTWKIAADAQDEGTKAQWFDAANFPMAKALPIEVPGEPTEVWGYDGSFLDAPSKIAWYSRTFPLQGAVQANMRYYLRFGAAKQTCEVWLNGTSLGKHDGGEDPFEFDVTKLLQPGQPNTVAVRLVYGVMGGITQHVAIIAQPEVRIIDAFARPDAKNGRINLEVTLENNTPDPAQIRVEARLGEFKPARKLGSQSMEVTATPGTTVTNLVLPVDHPHLWDLNDPFLYTLQVTSKWQPAGSAVSLRDSESFRTGFRDFRIVNDYFYLNGRRIFIASTHGNYYDPISIQGTPRDMRFLGRDFPQLKKAGFNMFRFIVSAALPEQLDQADELGFLIFSEHETSWQLKDPAKFGNTLNQVVRRDRNHPSLVLWGLLNETADQAIFQRARNWLPSLRTIDDTRPVMMSSGRWDNDFKTGSISNTGSKTFDVYLGGEDPVQPKPTGALHELGAYHDGTGDAHVYPFYPLSWSFVTDFAKVAQDTHPFFLSESGMGSSFNPIEEGRLLKKFNAPDFAYAWRWVRPGVDGMTKTWATYGLADTYPNMEDMMVDSDLSAARQRELIFSMVRSNPKIIGYNLTSLEDFWGAGEGIMNNFRDFKPGHLAVMQAGWAPLRWCLFVNPMNVYADKPIHVKVALANLDVLPEGDYPVTVTLSGPDGVAWTQGLTAHIQKDGPLAYTLFDQDITVPNLKGGEYELKASLDKRTNAAAPSLAFTVTAPESLPKLSGPVTVAGMPQNIRDFLTAHGAQIHDYAAGEKINHEVLLVGPDFTGKAADWRALYGRAAMGSHLIFLAEQVFHTDKARNKWLALPQKGDQNQDLEWLYHRDNIGKVNEPLLAGLPAKLLVPEIYGPLLPDSHFFTGVTVPDETAAIAIRSTDQYTYADGVMLGTYQFDAGHFTINGFNIVAGLGSPAADRLLLNLVVNAQADASSLAPLPADYDSVMDKLGMVDAPAPTAAP